MLYLFDFPFLLNCLFSCKPTNHSESHKNQKGALSTGQIQAIKKTSHTFLDTLAVSITIQILFSCNNRPETDSTSPHLEVCDSQKLELQKIEWIILQIVV